MLEAVGYLSEKAARPRNTVSLQRSSDLPPLASIPDAKRKPGGPRPVPVARVASPWLRVSESASRSARRVEVGGEASGGPSRKTAMSGHTARVRAGNDRASLYSEITDKIIAELEAGRVLWMQPWGTAAIKASLAMPRNAATQRRYSGLNNAACRLICQRTARPDARFGMVAIDRLELRRHGP